MDAGETERERERERERGTQATVSPFGVYKSRGI